MRPLPIVFGFSLLALLPAIRVHAAFFPCGAVLAAHSGRFSPSPEVQALREEVFAANQVDRASGRPGANVSNFPARAAVRFDPGAATGSNVVSLGSGPDVFLPLYSFPTARAFHLVDLLGGWGKGPLHVIQEIEARLAHVGSDAVVARVEEGFIKDLGQSLLEDRRPAHWRVRWTSPSQGPQERDFYLHPLDFDDPADIGALVRFLMAGPSTGTGLGGMLMTGIGASLKTLESLMGQMKEGGVFLAEMNFRNREGRLFDSDAPGILAALGQSYDVHEFPSWDGWPEGAYIPRLYVVIQGRSSTFPVANSGDLR